MGFLDSLGSVVSRVVPTAIGFATGNFAGAATALAGVEQAKSQKKKFETERFNAMQLQDFPGPLTSFAGAPTQAASPGFFAPGGAFRTGVRDFGGFLKEVSPIASVFGFGNRFENLPPPSGAQTINFTPPAETAMSGEITGANLGLGTGLVQAARGLARSPAGQGLIGGGLGLAGGLLAPDGNGSPRITRKMKSDVRKIYMMSGMDPNATAQILNNLGTYPKFNFNATLVFFILTKRFRNDGPVLTKAAVRKTRTTLRRMKNIVDLHNSICKTTTRRTPARRAAPKAVQLIKN
tara:strand:- start:103 stop:981 length:879 start_codon:yes stop_codon:yes gene_type:complete